MTRKREDGTQTPDRSQMAWRGFYTLVTSFFVYLGIVKENTPSSQTLQPTMERIEKRLDRLDERLTEDFAPRLTKLEQRLNSMFNAVNRNPQTGGK